LLARRAWLHWFLGDRHDLDTGGVEVDPRRMRATLEVTLEADLSNLSIRVPQHHEPRKFPDAGCGLADLPYGLFARLVGRRIHRLDDGIGGR
jgi:hypothetical protein